MAVPNPLLRYATDEFDADGIKIDWEISFVGGYINASHIYAMSGMVDPETQLLTDRTSHTVEVISEAEPAATVRIAPAVAAGRKLFIYRATPVAAMLVDYVNGSAITKKNLNLSNDQLLKIIQEMLDNLNITSLTVDQQVGTIVDLNQIIQNVYTEVLQLLAAGGIVSVDPRTWAGVWTGDTVDDQEFLLPGADVTGAGFYDVYVNGLGLEPNVDYEVVINEADLTQSFIRFTTVPAAESTWFAVLRGYAKPYTGPTPITQTALRVPMYEAPGAVFFADKAIEYGLVRCTDPAGCAVTVNLIPEVGDAETKLAAGSYFSFKQEGGVVTIQVEAGATLNVPAGCLPKTRGLNAVITLTCEDGDTNVWTLTGDLALDPLYVPGADSYVSMPQNSRSSAYEFTLSDSGKHVFHPSEDVTARTFTIPANAAVAFPIGAALTVINQNGAGVVTIAITSDTMRLAGSGATGSRTLAANGMATAVKIKTAEWIINGTGLT